MENTLKSFWKERRINNMNSRIEATQMINPITARPYLEQKYPKLRKLEDPIQAHLRQMEETNPSLKNHEKTLLGKLADRLSLIVRSLRYRNGEIEIFKVSPKYKFSNLKSTNLYYFDDKIKNLEYISGKKIEDYKKTFYRPIINKINN